MECFSRYIRKPEVLAGIIVIVVLLAVVGYSRFASRPEPAVAPPAVAAPSPAVAANKPPAGIARTGTVQNATVVPIDSDYPGKVSEVYVKEGEAVKAGQPLLKMEAIAAVGEAAAGTATQKPAAQTAGQDSYESALKEYNRLQKLYEQGAIPRRQMENAAARLQAVRESGASGRSAAVASYSGPVTVKAPIDGVVTGLATAAGNAVQVGHQFMGLGSGQAVEVVVPLEQKELYQVQLGDAAAIEAADRTIMGRVAGIFPEVRDNQVVSFQAQIKLIDLPAGLLKPGMMVKVSIGTGK